MADCRRRAEEVRLITMAGCDGRRLSRSEVHKVKPSRKSSSDDSREAALGRIIDPVGSSRLCAQGLVECHAVIGVFTRGSSILALRGDIMGCARELKLMSPASFFVHAVVECTIVFLRYVRSGRRRAAGRSPQDYSFRERTCAVGLFIQVCSYSTRMYRFSYTCTPGSNVTIPRCVTVEFYCYCYTATVPLPSTCGQCGFLTVTLC